MSDGRERAGWREDIGGDCTLEEPAKAARSLEFCGLIANRKRLQSDGPFVTLRSISGCQSKEKQMAFCSACGSEVGGAAFCPKCGAAQGAAAATAPVGGAPVASPTAGMEENVAGLLCYVLGWVTGLIFFLIDKRPFVRFHAAQSIGLSIGLIVVYIIVGFAFGMLSFAHLGILALALYPILGLVVFALWIFMMYKAYQHEKFKLPLIGDLAENMAGK
jgi:uncharacterized membrane protein